MQEGGKKQERRGGIETWGFMFLVHVIVSGSRNAVVALKRKSQGASGPDQNLKQERRGGIEIPGPQPEGLVDFLKQERRGGIETVVLQGPPDVPVKEAGTPWWH